MCQPAVGRWVVQLRLGVAPETVVPEVWATLGEEDRVVVIGRLSEAMAKVVVAAATGGQGGENGHEDIQGSQQGGASRIA